MLTPGELEAMSDAMAAAEAAVVAAEDAAPSVLWAWVPLVGLATQSTDAAARERARVARGLYEALRQVRDELLEAPGYDHERVLEVIALARKLADHDPAADVTALVETSPLSIAGRSLADTARQLAGQGPDGRFNIFAAAGKVGAVAVVLGVLFAVWLFVAPLLPLRRGRK